ncbi:MAG: FAD-dependent monooxygenase [Gemmatimonadota bacterium]|nr:MAG: FAD-dependent monooxygenase [Gemmatimonadota bacterium]
MVSVGHAVEAATLSDPKVLVVGAGPAGATLALELARRGLGVEILERKRFPRDKACGDCLNPGAVAELDRLGIADRLRTTLRPNRLRGWRVEAPDGRSFEASFSSTDVSLAAVEEGWAVRRRDFDAALLNAAVDAGVGVRFDMRVFDLLRSGERVVGVVARQGTRSLQIEGSLVVGADGLNSVVRRRLALAARLPRLRKIALVAHLACADGGEHFGELRVRRGRSCGFAPLPGGANVTLVIAEREARRVAGDPRRFFEEALASFPELRARVRSSALEDTVLVTGPFDRPVKRAWAAGALLVGDAAGYYDPFTGQGIYQALRSARLAAEAVVAALADPTSEGLAFRRYDRALRREFAPKRGLQRAIEAAISRPRLMSRLVAALARGEAAAARRLLRATGDIEHPASLLDPLFMGRLLVGMVGR